MPEGVAMIQIRLIKNSCDFFDDFFWLVRFFIFFILVYSSLFVSFEHMWGQITSGSCTGEDGISYDDVYRSCPKLNKTIVPVTDIWFVCEPELKGTSILYMHVFVTVFHL